MFRSSDEPAVSIYSRTAEDPGALLREWDDQSEQGLLSANPPVCSGGQTGLQRRAGNVLFYAHVCRVSAATAAPELSLSQICQTVPSSVGPGF